MTQAADRLVDPALPEGIDDIPVFVDGAIGRMGTAVKRQDERDGTEDGVETIIKAIEAAGYVPGKDVFIGLDCASSEFYDAERKVYDYTKFEGEGAAVRTAAEQIDYLEELVQ